jgi:hypothetical protein
VQRLAVKEVDVYVEDKRRGGEKERICMKLALFHHLFFRPRVYNSARQFQRTTVGLLPHFVFFGSIDIFTRIKITSICEII